MNPGSFHNRLSGFIALSPHHFSPSPLHIIIFCLLLQSKVYNINLQIMKKKQLFLSLALLFALPIHLLAQLHGDKYPSFVDADSMPHIERILPTPPDTASMNFFNDYVQYQWGKTLRGTERGRQAATDAELEDFEFFLGGFADAFGLKITREGTPELFNLFFWTKNDACNTTYRLKKSTYRKRPYVQFREGTLIPEEEEDHYKSSSYPSNHSAAGWATALLMVEINPAAQDAILKHGYEYGQSRVIAGYHYQSDVDHARLAAAAAIARVHTEPFFQKQLAKAKKEYEKILKQRNK